MQYAWEHLIKTHCEDLTLLGAAERAKQLHQLKAAYIKMFGQEGWRLLSRTQQTASNRALSRGTAVRVDTKTPLRPPVNIIHWFEKFT